MGISGAANAKVTPLWYRNGLATATNAHNVIIGLCSRTTRHKGSLEGLKPLLSLHINLTQPDFSRWLADQLESRAYQPSTLQTDHARLVFTCFDPDVCQGA